MIAHRLARWLQLEVRATHQQADPWNPDSVYQSYGFALTEAGHYDDSCARIASLPGYQLMIASGRDDVRADK